MNKFDAIRRTINKFADEFLAFQELVRKEDPESELRMMIDRLQVCVEELLVVKDLPHELSRAKLYAINGIKEFRSVLAAYLVDPLNFDQAAAESKIQNSNHFLSIAIKQLQKYERKVIMNVGGKYIIHYQRDRRIH
jgi:hypothetical protein